MRKANPDPTRILVFELITQVNREGAFANIRLPELLNKSKLNSKDRNLATEMAYGTLRMQGLMDYLAGKFVDRPFNELDGKIQDLIRMGIYQITQMRIPDHASVGETVEVARAVAGESKSSYVNAILRKISASEFNFDDIESLPTPEKLSIQYSHPVWIVNAFYDRLKDWQSVEELLRADNLATRPDIVCWPTKSSKAELINLGAKPIENLKNGFTIEEIPSNFAPITERRAGVRKKASLSRWSKWTQYLTKKQLP